MDLERFLNARTAEPAQTDPLRHLNDAVRFYHQGLDLTPPDAVAQMARIHNQLGMIYGEAGQLDLALRHYGRFADARHYALAALRDYQTYGAGAGQDVQQTLDLIARIDKAAQPPPA